MIERPNQGFPSMRKSSFTSQTHDTANLSCPSSNEHRFADRISGSMSIRSLGRYTVVPLALPSASNADFSRTKNDTSAMCTPIS